MVNVQMFDKYSVDNTRISMFDKVAVCAHILTARYGPELQR